MEERRSVDLREQHRMHRVTLKKFRFLIRCHLANLATSNRQSPHPPPFASVRSFDLRQKGLVKFLPLPIFSIYNPWPHVSIEV